jgi:hypothetical protein
MKLDPDSDLGNLEVTVAVGSLESTAVKAALGAGAACACKMQTAGLIYGAVLLLDGSYRVVGDELADTIPAAA